MTIMMIPLSCLRLSKQNVRKTGAEKDIEALAASILANGVLQNLIGVATKSKKIFDVIAGSRRMLALHLLKSRGEIDDTYQVPFRSIDANGANVAETSLAENFHRLAMSPADECRAFQYFLGEDGDIDAVAKRFGLTRRFIEGRLRLANLASVIFDALSDGRITLDVAKAYAATADQARQLQIYEQLQDTWQANDTAAIRRTLQQNAVSSDHPAALFLGEAAYVKAGGRIERDLFSDETGTKWLDTSIIEELAFAKLTDEAERLRVDQGLAGVVPILSTQVPYQLVREYQAVQGTWAELNDEQRAKIEALKAEIERLGCLIDEFDDDADSEGLTNGKDAIYGQRRAAEFEMRAIENDRFLIVDPEIRATAHQFLILTPNGTPKLDPRLFVEPVATAKDVAEGETAPHEGLLSDETERPMEEHVPSEKALSQKLIAELSMQRRDILALHIANNPALAFDYASFALADRMLRHSGSTGNALVLGSREDPMGSAAEISTPAGEELARIETMLDRSWCESADVVQRFVAFQALDANSRAAWLAFCVGHGVKATLANDTGYRCAKLHNHLGGLLDIDVAAWWRPTAENYFGRINKARMVNILDEFGGSTLAARYAAAKRGELAIACEKLCAGNAIVEPEIRDRATQWVPPLMLFSPTVIANDDDAWECALDADSAALNDTAESVSEHETPVEADAVAAE